MVLAAGRRVDNALLNSPAPAPRSAQICGIADGGIPFFINAMAVLSSNECKLPNPSGLNVHAFELKPDDFDSLDQGFNQICKSIPLNKNEQLCPERHFFQKEQNLFYILVVYTTSLMKAPDSLSSNIVYLCGEFSHVFHQMLTKAFKENNIGVTVEQFSVLAMLFY